MFLHALAPAVMELSKPQFRLSRPWQTVKTLSHTSKKAAYTCLQLVNLAGFCERDDLYAYEQNYNVYFIMILLIICY